ncbi:MAG: glycoside hydrolase family 28 protein [Oscillospiraceae bacterium]
MMELNTVAVLQRAATFEIEDSTSGAYYSLRPYSIALNGEEYGAGDTNVFCLFGLQPAMFYEVEITMQGFAPLRQSFITPAETLLLNAAAFGTGSTGCTAALQAAIAACPAGGTVYVPAGVYLTGPLFLHSDMLLYLEQGAVLRGAVNRGEYPILPGMVRSEETGAEKSFASWEGNPLNSYAALLTAIEANNIAVAGPGTIDGNAQNGLWWQQPKIKQGAWRPRTIFAVRCTGVTLLGVTVKNSASWTVHPYYSKQVNVLGVTIQNPPDSPNTDGCNPESCEDVNVIGTSISVGDDCISVKSGKYYMAMHHPMPSRNILVRNCRLQRGHGAVVVGSEIASGVYGLRVQRCLMQNTERGLRIKTRRGRGETSVVDNIEFADIVMQNVQMPFVVNMFYFCDPDGHSHYVGCKQPLPPDELTPAVKGLYCHDIECTGSQFAGAFFYGLPESPIQSIVLENISVSFDAAAKAGVPDMMDDVQPVKKLALFACNVQKLLLQNVRFEGNEGESFQLENVETFINQ